MSIELRIKNTRISFPQLFKPEAIADDENAKKKYSANFILDDKTTIEYRERGQKEFKPLKNPSSVIKLGEKAMEAKFNGKVPAKHDQWVLRDCDAMVNDDGEQYAGYEAGGKFIAASSEKRPAVVNRRKEPITEDDDVIYAGCRVTAFVDIYAYEFKGKKGVTASLEGIMFTGDDEPLGATKRSVDDMFEDEDQDELEELSDDDLLG